MEYPINYTVINSAVNKSDNMPEPKNILKTIHNAGFFSNCTIRLMDIIEYINSNNQLPDEVDSTEQFMHYKGYAGQNLIPYFFNEDAEKRTHVIGVPIPFNYDCMSLQFADYNKLPFKELSPIIEKYFTPSIGVELIRNTMREKYQLFKHELCAVFYRGNDKSREMKVSGYDVFIERAKLVKEQNPKVKFLVQPDEKEFLDAFLAEFPDSIYFDETPMLSKMDSAMFFELPMQQRAEYAAKFYAALLLLSECKHAITHSGNCGLWMTIYRGNTTNLHQVFNDKWY